MLHAREFDAWVTVDGMELPQYGCEHIGDKVTCWIPSEAGKRFTVHFKDNLFGRTEAMCGWLRVDGYAVVPIQSSQANNRPREIGAI